MAILIKFFSFIISLAPIFLLEKICCFLAYLLVQFPNPRRRVLLSNLSHAFPYWSKEELYSNAKESAARMVEMGLFSLIYPFMNMDKRKRTVFYDKQAQSLLEDLNEKDTPVLFLLPHVCLFESLATSPFFRPANPKKMGAIYRPNRNLSLDKWIRDARIKTDIEVFSRKTGLRESMYFLRQKNWLTLLFDQNGGEGGADFLFLDRVASLTPLPDIFSKIENIRIVYACPKRIKMFRTELFLKEINLNEDVSVCQKAHELLSQDIQNCPKGFPEWLWAHGKWKVHYYPEVRFNLSSKRSFLNANNISRSGSRIVIRIPNWLGDVVMSLPIIRALRKARPDMQFLFMGRSMFLPLLKEFELGEEFISTDYKNLKNYLDFLIEVRSKMPECHLLFTNSLRGDLESLIIGSPQRFGLKLSGKKRPFLTNALCIDLAEFNSQHLTITWESMIRKFGFLENISYEPFMLSVSDRVKTVTTTLKIGIALGSSNNPAKQWPVNSWIQLIHLLVERESDIKVVLYGTKSDFGLSSQILAQNRFNVIRNLVGQTSVVQLAEEFSACTLVIGCDSGAVHLASAVGTPTLTIFGPTNHTVTSPCFNNIKRELVLASPSHSMRDWCATKVFEEYKKLVSLVQNQ